MNESTRQVLTALRSASFNNAHVADRLRSFAGVFPDLQLELSDLARQLDEDADALEALVRRSGFVGR